ncbi:MAG: membrane protein insertion efficiency factor YidD [Fibrobacteres bacterium]|nr:membrane protein insertion efficiency factor YidD [Fibrobacterota bacterium]
MRFAIIILFASISTFAGLTEDYLSSVTNQKTKNSKIDSSLSYNPINWVLDFYQNFISTQDGDNCSFHPSCSHYAKTAIKSKGIIKGTLMSADRLIRCNGPQHDIYEAQPTTGLNIDTIKTEIK